MAGFGRPSTRPSDDPRRLWDLVGRTRELSTRHEVGSVVVGLAAPEGDLQFPDVLSYVESELRVEDAVFRMTRERAVLFLADVDLDEARGIVERMLLGFREQFPVSQEPRIHAGYCFVPPRVSSLAVGPVLRGVFIDAPDSAPDA